MENEDGCWEEGMLGKLWAHLMCSRCCSAFEKLSGTFEEEPKEENGAFFRIKERGGSKLCDTYFL